MKQNNMFTAHFFSDNRERLAAAVPDALIVIPAHTLLQKSADMAFPFRQDSNFWYLTGLDMSDSILLINSKQGDAELLLPEQSDYQKEWEGAFNKKLLKQRSGISTLATTARLEERLRAAKREGIAVCYLEPLAERAEPYGFYTNPSRRLVAERIRQIVDQPRDIRIELARLRQIKQPVEVAALQEAVDITGRVLSDVKRRLSSFANEKDIERAISAGFFGYGADGHAYGPIIASGAHATVIHYEDNDGDLEKDELMLLDVGALHGMYGADISRTWAYGVTTQRQRDVFDAVISLQDTAFSLLKPGVKLREYQKEMERHSARHIKQLGQSARPYPHGFSHFLGIDVHDAGDYDTPLLPGSVLTVEPGLYFADERIGVRIEDNVLVTEHGIEILSKDIPRSL